MRYAVAVIALFFVIGNAAATEDDNTPEPVYNESGKLEGYVLPHAADQMSETECVPEDERPYPLCFTFADDGDDD